MSNEAVLAQLVGQAMSGGRGAGADMATLRAMIEEAGELGAARAMTRLGLADDAAHGDLAELRELLRAWRDAKRSAVRAVAGWIIRLLLALVLVGLAVRMGFGDWVK